MSVTSNRNNRRDNNNNDYKMKKKPVKKNDTLLLTSFLNSMKPLYLRIDNDTVKSKPKSYVDIPTNQYQSQPFNKGFEDTWFSFTKKWYPVVIVGIISII